MIKVAISFEYFQKVDIRIGTIIDVQDFPKAKVPAYQIKIDFGAIGIKRLNPRTCLNRHGRHALDLDPARY